MEQEPFEPVSRHTGAFRIRKRNDGACGFLSTENRCRIHEELGGHRKPLTCRLFPYRFHPLERETLVAASFSCPTVVSATGATLDSQESELKKLEREWFDQYPESTVPLLFFGTRPISAASAADFRSILRRILERQKADGTRDLRENVCRIAHYCEDLTRHRVLRLAEKDFAEYLVLTGKYAATNDKTIPMRPPSWLSLLLFRGFLFSVISLRMRFQERETTGLRLGFRLRLLRVLAHLHGLMPPIDNVNLKALDRVSVPLSDPDIDALVSNYLRSSIVNLGTARLPMIDELGFAVAQLNAAFALAAMQIFDGGNIRITADALALGLTEAADISHAEMRTSFFSGIESLYLFASKGKEVAEKAKKLLL